MKIKIFFVLLSALVFTGGCETFKDIDAAAGEWARKNTAERAARAEAQRNSRVLTSAPRGRGCQRVVQSLTLLRMDPDTAYVRLKRYFDFSNRREAEIRYPYPEALAATNYRHETLPGVRYAMSEGTTWPSTAYGRQDIWLNLDVERDRSNTIVSWNYCINTDGWEVLGDPDAIKRNLAADIKHVVAGSQ